MTWFLENEFPINLIVQNCLSLERVERIEFIENGQHDSYFKRHMQSMKDWSMECISYLAKPVLIITRLNRINNEFDKITCMILEKKKKKEVWFLKEIEFRPIAPKPIEF